MFAFTGPATIRGMRIVRADLIKLAESKGHHVAAGPRQRGIDYLVTDTPYSGSQKNVAAKRHGVTIITAAQFLELCGGKIEIRQRSLLT